MELKAVPLEFARAPRRVHQLLTLTQACRRFGLYHLQIYAAVEQGKVNPVQPHGRILYPIWELEAVFGKGPRASYPDPSEPAAAMFAAA
jgi:hypothetical protein